MFHRMMNYGEIETRPSVSLTRELIRKNMPRYKRHGDLVVIRENAWEEFKKSLPMPVSKDENSPFSVDEDELAFLVCHSLPNPPCKRLAIDRGVKDDEYRSPLVDVILGTDGMVTRKENQIMLEFDITKCMYSFGNIKEKMRMAELDCSDQIVVDLFAGIGYFSLPLLVHAKARHLYACEWNPEAVKALKNNLKLNKVDESRCTVLEGDNRSNRPTDVAQRVLLGILPSCLEWMTTAFECIDKTTGAILHCHDLVELKPAEEESAEVGDKADGTQEDGEDNNDSEQVVATETCANDGEAIDTQLDPCDQNGSIEDRDTNSSPDQSSSLVSNGLVLDGSPKTPEKGSQISHDSDSDKDCSPPVLLEKPSPSEYPADQSNSSVNNDTSSSASNREDVSLNESLLISDREMDAYQARAQLLMSRIQDDVDSHDLKISLLHIQPVKSYAPHINHVVFDIEIAPKSSSGGPSSMVLANPGNDQSNDDPK